MIRAILVDDEQPSADKLEKMLQNSGMVEIKVKFTEPLKALEFLKTNKIDAAFLDIEMPDMDGIELSNRILDLQGKIAIVFVTAYNQYAVEAFRLNALDYLLKPVAADRLKETLDRIVEEKNIGMNYAGLTVRCFGKFRVTTGSEEVKFRTEKAEELLALLIDRRGSFVSRSEIIDCLWEEYEGDRALIHFNTTLHYVKKALLRHGVQVPIEHDRGSYRIDTGSLTCDYCGFHTLAAGAGAASPDNVLKCEEAAALYVGDYLSGKDYAWAERNRQLLKDQFISLMIQLSEYYKADGSHKKTVEWMKAGLMQEPLHRELNYRLIEALLSANDRLSARRYYDIYRNGLRKKLKQEPDDVFKKLMR
ncbi:MAG: response regulator [Bacillota bacterium]